MGGTKEFIFRNGKGENGEEERGFEFPASFQYAETSRVSDFAFPEIQ